MTLRYAIHVTPTGRDSACDWIRTPACSYWHVGPDPMLSADIQMESVQEDGRVNLLARDRDSNARAPRFPVGTNVCPRVGLIETGWHW